MRADDRAKFKPRASRCSHCPEVKELDPVSSEIVQCGIFGWEMSRDLAKKQAVCRTDDKQRGIVGDSHKDPENQKECDKE